jgi:hypothetical protein
MFTAGFALQFVISYVFYPRVPKQEKALVELGSETNRPKS